MNACVFRMASEEEAICSHSESATCNQERIQKTGSRTDKTHLIGVFNLCLSKMEAVPLRLILIALAVVTSLAVGIGVAVWQTSDPGDPDGETSTVF